MDKRYFFLAGLPRSGSTLLTTLLAQNSDVHAEGNSAVASLMWDLFLSINKGAKEQLAANHKQETGNELIRLIPDFYYRNTDKPIVFDKCRNWVNPANLHLIKNYITPNPKIIVLLRPIEEIIKSFVRLYRKNGIVAYDINRLLVEDTEPIMKSYAGIKYQKENNSEDYLYLTYEELITDTRNTLNRIYEFCGLEPFTHDLKNIVNHYPEDDSVYKMAGMHDVRSTIKKADYTVNLSPDVIDYCKKLNEILFKK